MGIQKTGNSATPGCRKHLTLIRVLFFNYQAAQLVVLRISISYSMKTQYLKYTFYIINYQSLRLFIKIYVNKF